MGWSRGRRILARAAVMAVAMGATVMGPGIMGAEVAVAGDCPSGPNCYTQLPNGLNNMTEVPIWVRWTYHGTVTQREVPAYSALSIGKDGEWYIPAGCQDLTDRSTELISGEIWAKTWSGTVTVRQRVCAAAPSATPTNPTAPPANPPATTQHWVDLFADADGYRAPGGQISGKLSAGTNYVYCKAPGPEVRAGDQYNIWWLKTDLDVGDPWQGQWISAYYLARWGNNEAKDNSGSEIPNC